jgi:RNA polymerase sigma-70 factor (ECF subfamily)
MGTGKALLEQLHTQLALRWNVEEAQLMAAKDLRVERLNFGRDCRAIDRLRRRQAYSRARERYEKSVVQESQTLRRDAAEGLVLNDLRKFLKKSIRALPRLQREAVELAFFNGLSHREIAAATRAPLGTVKTRLELGLQKLTHALRPLRHKV